MIYGYSQSGDPAEAENIGNIATNVLCDYSLSPPEDFAGKPQCRVYTEADACIRMMLLEERLFAALKLAEAHGADTAALFREDTLFSENITDIFSEPFQANP